MAILHRVTEGALRQMAREATSLHTNQGVELTDAVVKVASAYEAPLTSEHARRVCEMAYHDVFERSFRDTQGQHRVVSFDPPDADKVAAAIRAEQIRSFRNKVASAPPPSSETEKMASAQAWQPTPPPNAFSSLVGGVVRDPTLQRRQARNSILKTADAVKEAERALRVEIGSLKNASLLAYQELGRQVRHEVVNNGVLPERVLAACTGFMKEGGAPDHVCEGVIKDLAVDMLKAGLNLCEKRAALYDVTPNASHPLNRKVSKVAHLRAQRLHREYALEEVLSGRSRVERELRSALFS